jgi:hypothetical protein
MTEDQFWTIIDECREKCDGEVECQAAQLIERLSREPEKAIAEYQAHFLRFMDQAYDARVWAAGSLLDELSDDGFTDFRAWLISRGRNPYFRCLANPEELTEIATPGERVTAEEINSVAYKAYSTKTGRSDFFERFHFDFSPTLKNEALAWKTVQGFPDPEKLCSLFPQLCRRFGTPS